MLKRSKKNFLFAEMSDSYACGLVVDRQQGPYRVESSFAFFGEELDDCKGKVREVAGMDRKSNLAQAAVAVYPTERFLFRHITDNPAKTRGADYGNKVLSEELKRKPEEHRFVCLNPRTGLPHDPLNLPTREVMLAGAPTESIRQCQQKLIECGVYPSRLEIASLAIYAGIRQLLQQDSSGSSVLVIELGNKDFFAYVVDREGLTLTEALPSGIEAVTSALMRELSLRDGASGRGNVQQLLLVGTMAMMVAAGLFVVVLFPNTLRARGIIGMTAFVIFAVGWLMRRAGKS